MTDEEYKVIDALRTISRNCKNNRTKGGNFCDGCVLDKVCFQLFDKSPFEWARDIDSLED